MGGEFFGMDGISFGEGLGRLEEEEIEARKTSIKNITKALDHLDPSIDKMERIDDIIEGEGIDIDSLTPEEKRKINKHL